MKQDIMKMSSPKMLCSTFVISYSWPELFLGNNGPPSTPHLELDCIIFNLKLITPTNQNGNLIHVQILEMKRCSFPNSLLNIY